MPETPLVAAVIGNGRMLCNLDSTGELNHLYWPHIDFPNHVKRVTAGVQTPARREVFWLTDPTWSIRQRYTGDAPIVETVAESAGLGLVATITDFVTPCYDTLIRRYQWRNKSFHSMNIRFIFYAALQLAESGRYNSVFWDPQAGALAFYRRDIWMVVGGARSPVGYKVGPRRWDNSAWNDAQDGYLGGGAIEMNDIDGALAWESGEVMPGGMWQITVFISPGETRQKALAALAAARGQGAGALEKATGEAWGGWLQQSVKQYNPLDLQQQKSPTIVWQKPHKELDSPVLCQETSQELSVRASTVEQATDNHLSEKVERITRRSQVITRLLTDEGGGIIAAPEFDPERLWCGGYGFCWGRDAAYIVYALDIVGRHDLTASFYRWAARVQEPSGVWYQRYWVTGELGPSWGLIQIDETGSILWGLWQHIRLTSNYTLLRELWPCVERAAAFLARFRDAETGLLQASWDLWEERQGVHTYSCAAVYGGLIGAAQLAQLLGRVSQARDWNNVAEELREAVIRHCWSDLHGRFLRSVNLRVPEWAMHDPSLSHRVRRLPPMPGCLYPEYIVPDDATVDSSLLGLVTPFGMFAPNDPKVMATVAAIERDLTRSPAGGVLRYTDDHYRGGNPWVLCTLWLAQYYVAQGNRSRARQLLDWAVDHSTSLDLLPEQVDRNTGVPAWVVPLAWSHAMFMLTVAMLRE